MEFDKCMANDSTEKLKGMDEEQILKFQDRVDFYKKENQAELDKLKQIKKTFD